MNWLIFIAIVFVIIYVTKNKKSAPTQNLFNETLEEEQRNVSEEAVFQAQTRFEKKLSEETEFPDAISGIEIYIYKNLMLPWYNKLAAKSRYDETLIQKLRRDWLDYMEAVEDRSTYNYLWLETQDDEERSERYRADHITAARKVFAIQNAFAAAMGEDAVAELNKTKEMDFMKFSQEGELAPKGFEWGFGRKELVPIKRVSKRKDS